MSSSQSPEEGYPATRSFLGGYVNPWNIDAHTHFSKHIIPLYLPYSCTIYWCLWHIKTYVPLCACEFQQVTNDSQEKETKKDRKENYPSNSRIRDCHRHNYLVWIWARKHQRINTAKLMLLPRCFWRRVDMVPLTSDFPSSTSTNLKMAKHTSDHWWGIPIAYSWHAPKA